MVFDMESFDLPRCSLQFCDEGAYEQTLPEPRPFHKRNDGKSVPMDAFALLKIIRSNRAAVGKEISEHEPAKWTIKQEERRELVMRTSQLLLS